MPTEPKELNAQLLRNLAETGPVVMVNLVRFRAHSRDGNGSGWDAYVRYSEGVMPLIKGGGGTVLWAGNAEAVAYGDAEQDRWDYVVLVRYPSRKAFLEMVTSAEYARANVHRDNGVERHVIVAMKQSYSKT